MKIHRISPFSVMFSLVLTFNLVPKTAHAINVNPESCEKLIINLLQPAIEEEMVKYYGEDLGKRVELYNYEMSILDLTAEPYKPTTVTLKITPMIGAHHPIGDYELYFSVDNAGEIKRLSFKPLKIYPETIERFQLTLPEME